MPAAPRVGGRGQGRRLLLTLFQPQEPGLFPWETGFPSGEVRGLPGGGGAVGLPDPPSRTRAGGRRGVGGGSGAAVNTHGALEIGPGPTCSVAQGITGLAACGPGAETVFREGLG